MEDGREEIEESKLPSTVHIKSWSSNNLLCFGDQGYKDEQRTWYALEAASLGEAQHKYQLVVLRPSDIGVWRRGSVTHSDGEGEAAHDAIR